MNKQKLLYIITHGHWGGAQKYVFDLATTLADDFDITVAVGEPDNSPDLQKKLKGKNIDHIQLKHLRRPISPIRDILAIFELYKLFKKEKPDIIHLNSSKASILGSLATYSILQAKKLRSYKLIYTVHGWVFNEPMSQTKKFIYKVMEGISSRRKNKIIVLSDTEKNIGINTLRIKEQKFCVIPVGIQKTEKILDRNSAIKKLNTILGINILSEKDYIFGTIANFYPTKNLDNLISAVGKIKDKLNNFNLILIGSGPKLDCLKSKITSLKLEDFVHLSGFLENASQYLPAFDLFVLPSNKEGLPYTLLEAKINKVPIIATDVGAIHTIVENKKTGLLIPPKNIDKLAEAILFAYNHQQNMKKMAEIGYNENTAVNSKKYMIEETTKVYKLKN